MDMGRVFFSFEGGEVEDAFAGLEENSAKLFLLRGTGMMFMSSELSRWPSDTVPVGWVGTCVDGGSGSVGIDLDRGSVRTESARVELRLVVVSTAGVKDVFGPDVLLSVGCVPEGGDERLLEGHEGSVVL